MHLTFTSFLVCVQVLQVIPTRNQMLKLGWWREQGQAWEERSVSEDSCLHQRKKIGYIFIRLPTSNKPLYSWWEKEFLNALIEQADVSKMELEWLFETLTYCLNVPSVFFRIQWSGIKPILIYQSTQLRSSSWTMLYIHTHTHTCIITVSFQ